MYFKTQRIILICFLCLSIWLPFSGKAHAADVYSVIYNEVSSCNGNPQEAAWITQAILYASSAYGVDPFLVTSVMEQESHFVVYGSQSTVGAIGLMQLMPDTAQAIGVNPYDPLDNILGGVIYLKNQLDNFSGWGQYAVTDAVAAYNAGPQAVKKYQGVPPYGETRNYVVCIANNYNRLISTY